MKEIKKHSCPICSIPLVEYERYPLYVCLECSNNVTDIKGKRLAFCNVDLTGGFSAKYIDSGRNYNSHTCYIEGIECYADEARFGGIVVQKVISEINDSSELESASLDAGIFSKKNYIMGAIIGDVIGSVYEWHNVKTTEFQLFSQKTHFTDDSVLTFATMDSILHQIGYTQVYQTYAKKFPDRGYGGKFTSWINTNHPRPYNSWGNGSAMRVSPVGWAYDTLDEVLAQAKKSAEVTHNHPEGIKGAQATASAIFLSRKGKSKLEIKQYIEQTFNYNLDRSIAEIRPAFRFDESCQGTVPEAIIAFLESTDFENAIRFAISLGGDSDTIACITGGIAEAFYKEIPEFIIESSLRVLPAEIIELIVKFSLKFRKLD